MLVIAHLLILATASTLVASELKEILSWKHIPYDWESEDQRKEAEESGIYNYTSIFPRDVDRDEAGRIFLLIVGLQGEPASLGIVPDASNKINFMQPLIKPYPDWSWFNTHECDKFIHPFKIAIDECNQLWVLDNGNFPGQENNCSAKLMIFNLADDKHIKNIFIPDEIAKDENKMGVLTDFVVETNKSECNKNWVYIANTWMNTLLVSSGNNDWNVKNLSLPLDEPTVFSGEAVLNQTVNISSLALVNINNKTNLFFRPLSSKDLFSIKTDDLKQGDENYTAFYHVLPSQVTAMASSSAGMLYFGLTKENAVGCWNKDKELAKENIGITAQNDETLRLLQSVKVIKQSTFHPEELLVLSNRYLEFISGLFKYDEIHYRVFIATIEELKCNTTYSATEIPIPEVPIPEVPE